MQDVNTNSTSLTLLELGIHDFQQIDRVEKIKPDNGTQTAPATSDSRRRRLNNRQPESDSSQWESIGNDQSAEEISNSEISESGYVKDKTPIADKIQQGKVDTRELIFL